MDNQTLNFQIIHDTFRPRLHRYLAHLVGEDEAEDLAQEVFIHVEQALPDFRGESQISTWLYRIATNAALDRMRSPAYRCTEPLLLLEDASDDDISDHNLWTGESAPSVEQQLFRQQMNDCLHNFIQSLPTDYRTVLVLSEIEQMRNSEIADVLGITLGTVKIRLHRARQALKKMLEANCGSDWVEGNDLLPDLKHVLEDEDKNR